MRTEVRAGRHKAGRTGERSEGGGLRHSLRVRMLLFFLIVTLVSIGVLATSFFVLTAGIIRENSNRLLADLVQQIAAEMDDLFAGARRTLEMVANDPKIQQVLRSPYPEQVSALYSTELEVDNQLSFVQSYVEDIFGIYIIGANGTAYKSNFFSGKDGRWTEALWYRRIQESEGTVWLGPHPGAFTVETIGQPIVTIGQSIIDKASGRSLGVILVDIEVKTIEEILRGNLGGRGYIGLLDQHGRVVTGIQGYSGADRALEAQLAALGTAAAEGPPAPDPRPGPYLTFSRPLEVGPWKTVGVIPEKELTREMASISKFIAILFTGICLLDLLAALYFTARLTNPLKELMLLMKRVETGDFQVNMDITSRDEIGRLSESFNLMVRRLDDSMRQLFANQQKLRKAQLTALQAQINPHFLYNTLDSVCWLAREEKKSEIISTVTALTKLLRIGLSKGDEIISIREEVEHVRNYLVIQKMRYGDILDYSIEVPEELNEYRIVKLVLQPLVENALYHGIKNKNAPGVVAIRAEQLNGSIVFRVSDTGIGMESDKLALLEKSLQEPEGRSDSFGLKNVSDRIRIYFGDGHGLSFASVAGRGTTVSFSIPLIRGE
jgi:two-component system sensor histidine kinase YesM